MSGKKEKAEKAATTAKEIADIDPPTVDVKYIIVTAEGSLGNKHYFEEAVSKKMWEGYKPVGGVDVKSISVNRWLFTQAMVKE